MNDKELGFALVALGMLGLYLNIEYSGIIIFLGALVLITE